MCSQNIYTLSIKSDTKTMEINAGTDLIYLLIQTQEDTRLNYSGKE